MDGDVGNLRYSIEREDDISAAGLRRAMGSATQLQAATNHFNPVLQNLSFVNGPSNNIVTLVQYRARKQAPDR